VLQRLVTPGALEDLLARARAAVFETFPGRLPERVRNNHIVDYFGIMLWCEIMAVPTPNCDVLAASVSNVFNVESGTTRTLADDMVEDVVNEVSQSMTMAPFKWAIDAEGTTVYFQITTTHNWWLQQRRRQGRQVLERVAIQTQLKEADYITGPVSIENTFMVGVNLARACERGLDVPSRVIMGGLRIKTSA
jgi:hypothetical protein